MGHKVLEGGSNYKYKIYNNYIKKLDPGGSGRPLGSALDTSEKKNLIQMHIDVYFNIDGFFSSSFFPYYLLAKIKKKKIDFCFLFLSFKNKIK